MKKIICLMIITAALLCSCRNSSFLTQRYTHYQHSAIAGEKQNVSCHTQNHTFAASSVNVTAGRENVILTDQAEKDFVTGSVSNYGTVTTKETANRKITPVKLLKKLAVHAKLAVKKNITTVKERKSGSRRGLVFGVIHLALFIALLVLLAAAVFYLVMLVA
jgi:hypothetical protein